MLALENLPSFVQFLLVSFSYLLCYCKDVVCNFGRKIPPGPKGYPLVGNLFQIGSKPKETFEKWHRKYGDVYSLRLGAWPCVVVNGYDAVYEALMKKKEAFADRPPFDSFKEYAGGLSISFQGFNKKYSIHRKMACKSLTSVLFDKNYKLDFIVSREIGALLTKMNEVEGASLWIDPQNIIMEAIGCILYSVCFGFEKQLKDDTTYLDLILGQNPTTDLFAVGNHPDLFPPMKYLSKYKLQKGHTSRMADFVKANNEKIAHHIKKFNNNNSVNSSNVMDSLISKAKNASENEDSPSLSQILASTIEFISAGVDTSSSTLLWLLLYMTKYPVVQEKVYKEISRMKDVSPECEIMYRERNKLPYTEACIWEVMRLNTIVPFALPHYSLYDSTLKDFYIQKGTIVFINLLSVCRDPKKWDDPGSFIPERFLVTQHDGSIAVDRQKVECFLPFSTGRRRCVGENLGKLQVFSIFTAIMGKYQLFSSSDTTFEGQFGDVQKPLPFQVKLKCR